MTKRGYIYLIIILGLITFFNSLYNGFVWDDEEQVLNNIAVHSLSNLPQLFYGSTFNTGGTGTLGGLYYKPLMSVFFSLIYTFFGPNPFFFHFFQVILHITNAVFVFLIFRYFFSGAKKDLIAFIPALIFLVHPINTEAVVYISSLQDTLFFFFGITALWMIVSKKVVNIKSFLLITILMLSSLFSKETGILFIFLVCFYSFLFNGKILKPVFISSFSSIAVYSFLRFFVAGIYFNKHGLTPISTLSFFERLLSIPKILFFYIKTFFYPKDLAISQHWIVQSVNFYDFFIPLVLILIISGILIWFLYFFWKKKSNYFKYYLFFLVWFFAGLIFHSNFIFPLDMTVSERWFYFPINGLLGILTILFLQIKLNKITKRFGAVFLMIILILLVTRTIVRNSDWINGLSLFSRDVQISINTFDLENNLGVELFRAGQFDEAGKHFALSTQIAPSWWTNWNNLGAIEERNGNFEAAKFDYQKAIDNGKYYLAYQNLAKLYLLTESPQKTIAFTEGSLKTLPNNASLWAILSIAEYKAGNWEKALFASKNAYLLNPNSDNAYIYNQLLQNLPLDIK